MKEARALEDEEMVEVAGEEKDVGTGEGREVVEVGAERVKDVLGVRGLKFLCYKSARMY